MFSLNKLVDAALQNSECFCSCVQELTDYCFTEQFIKNLRFFSSFPVSWLNSMFGVVDFSKNQKTLHSRVNSVRFVCLTVGFISSATQREITETVAVNLN